MKLLEDFVTPSRDEMASLDVDEARKIDQINKEIHKRNRMVVQKAKMVLRQAAPEAQTLQQMEPPAIPMEYARKFRDLIEKEREAAAAYEEKRAEQEERAAARAERDAEEAADPNRAVKR